MVLADDHVIRLPLTKGGMDYLKRHIRLHGYSHIQKIGVRIDQVDWDNNAAFIDFAMREVSNG